MSIEYVGLHNIGKIEILEIMFLDVITCGDDENDV